MNEEITRTKYARRGILQAIKDWAAAADRFIDDGDPYAARACAQELFNLYPKSANVPAILGECELYFGNLDKAESYARQSLEKVSYNTRAKLVLGGVAAERFELDVEIPLLREVVETVRSYDNPSILFRALTWLSNGLYLAGDPDGAAECLLKASRIKEDRAVELYGKHLFYLNYRRPPSRQASEKYQTFFDDITPIERASVRHKKIRVGYISPDFRQHAVANFVEPFIKNFDADHFQVTCYQTTRGDDVTDRLKKNKVRWRNLIDKTPFDSARKIAADEIDFLIDLSGHSQNSCLPILAYKPALIQMMAIGYVSSTGLNAVDYFLSDKHCLPSRSDRFTEKIFRMPDCHLCYAPKVVKKMPDVSKTPPCIERRHITFGSFNNFAKVSDRVLGLWKKILDGVEDSRLINKAKTCSIPSGRAIVTQRLIDVGIDPARVELRPFSPDYLEQYADVDIALDTFPYNGGLTTCEALYMGVPVIALEGETHGDRIAASILHSARSDELIASTEDEYIKKAVELGNDLERLKNYRSTLRSSMKKSPLMDQKLYMKNFEAVLKKMFRGE